MRRGRNRATNAAGDHSQPIECQFCLHQTPSHVQCGCLCSNVDRLNHHHHHHHHQLKPLGPPGGWATKEVVDFCSNVVNHENDFFVLLNIVVVCMDYKIRSCSFFLALSTV
ncbi:hypothetical protein T01_15869 [Trichinella spiralis]|uniref:Uncharacterized protein n=1 Tax=Trichinella spiralis TaxID=6334 RepID=A0A0V1BIG6_TRISP|nr:hypothetical protein T01_15869 [Trichinella spiralis]